VLLTRRSRGCCEGGFSSPLHSAACFFFFFVRASKMNELRETSAFIVLSRAFGFSAMCACVLFSVMFVVPIAPHWHVSALIPASMGATDYVWMVWMMSVSLSHIALSLSDNYGATSAESPSTASREVRTNVLPTFSVKTWVGIAICFGLLLVWTLAPTIFFQVNLSSYSWDTRVGTSFN
jgi:hypothetical protein